MSKKLRNFKQCRGDIITDEYSELEKSFNTKQKITNAEYKNLESLNEEELKELAAENNIPVVDNRNDLIKSIKKQLRK